MAMTMLDKYKTLDRFCRKQSTPLATPSTGSTFTESSRKHHTNFSLVKSPMFHILEAVEGFLLGYDSNTRAYRVFNKSTGLVKVSCDIVFDETNGSQVEQVDLSELDDEEALCVALRNMSIGDVCPKESKEPPQAQDQPSSSMQASPLTQNEDQAQDDEDENQEDEPTQEEDMDQGGDEDDQDKEDDQEIRDQRPPHPRFHQAIQRDHHVNSILGDIHKGVTTRYRVIISVNITFLFPLLSHTG
jgi:hypothetical protein